MRGLVLGRRPGAAYLERDLGSRVLQRGLSQAWGGQSIQYLQGASDPWHIPYPNTQEATMASQPRVLPL